MFETVTVIGAGGRAGSAIAAKLAERGLTLQEDGADLVLLCVPDAAIASAAAAIEPGPWVAHVSGATTLDALSPHARRFSVHPLQTLVAWRGPEQLDGAFAAITADDPQSLARARWLAITLGLEPFVLADAARPVYHAGAVIASNYLVTLYRASAMLFEDAGAPPEALVPLMRRTIENGFELTGPIARGDWETVSTHTAALHATRPELEPMYRTLAEMTAS